MKFSSLIIILFLFFLSQKGLSNQRAKDCYQAAFSQGKSLFLAGNYEQADTYFSEAEQCSDIPSDNDLFIWDNKNQRCKKLFRDGMDAYKKAQLLKAEDKKLNRKQIKVYYRLAAEALKEVYSLNPNHSEAKEKAKLSQVRSGITGRNLLLIVVLSIGLGFLLLIAVFKALEIFLNDLFD